MVSESSNRTSNGLLSFLGIAVLLVVVTVAAVGTLALTGLSGESLEQKRATARIAVRMRLEKEAQEKLASEGWVDKAKGLVHVTIADAIPLAVVELRNRKPAPSKVKVEPPLPIIAPDPNSKEPPPLLPSQGADLIQFSPPGTPAPAPAAAAPAPTAPAPAPAAPASAATSAPAPTARPAKPAAPPAGPAPRPTPTPQAAPAPAPPARPPLINPTENPAPTK